MAEKVIFEFRANPKRKGHRRAAGSAHRGACCCAIRAESPLFTACVTHDAPEKPQIPGKPSSREPHYLQKVLDFFEELYKDLYGEVAES